MHKYVVAMYDLPFLSFYVFCTIILSELVSFLVSDFYWLASGKTSTGHAKNISSLKNFADF